MNWGWKITIVYSAFVLMIVTLVILCTRQNVDLEYKDYYARELVFQEKLDAMNNEKALDQSIEHQVTPEALLLIAPTDLFTKGMEGELQFYCPSDASKDLNLPMKFDSEGKQNLPRTLFKTGMYKLRMTWTSAGKKYFKELVLNL